MQWLGGSIKERMSTYLIGLALLFAIQFAVTLWAQNGFHQGQAYQRLMNQVTAHQMSVDMKHDSIESDVLRMKDGILRNDTSAFKLAKTSLDEDIAAIDENFRFLVGQSYPEPLKSAVQAAAAPQRDYVAKAIDVQRRMESHPEDFNAALDSFIAAYETFEAVQAKLGNEIKTSIDTQSAADDRQSSVTQVVQLVSMLIGGASLAWVFLYTRRFVVDPLQRLATALRTMAGGNYDQPVEGYDNGDEIADLARVAQVFRANALEKQQADREQIEVVSALRSAMGELARKNLEYRIVAHFPGSYDGLRDDFNTALDALRLAMGSVRVSAGNLTASIAEIRSAADDLATRNEQQAARISETSEAMHTVTDSVQQTADQALSVRAAVARTQQEATEGGAVVRDAVTAMAAIEKSTSEITQITDLIDGIAFQTNLLALNAGVEAARAGDAGRGFAVVATEVRALAQRSADAAKDIKALIASSSQQVSSGVALVGQTGDKLIHIAERVDHITGSINEIADAATRQVVSLREVQTSVGEMDVMTQRNAAMAEETTAATRAVAAEADELTRLVAQFQTRDGGSRPETATNATSLRRTSLVGKAGPVRARQVPQPASKPAPIERPAQRRVHRSSGSAALAVDVAPPSGDNWSEF